MYCCACNGQCNHTGPCVLCYKHNGSQIATTPTIIINPTIVIR